MFFKIKDKLKQVFSKVGKNIETDKKKEGEKDERKNFEKDKNIINKKKKKGNS